MELQARQLEEEGLSQSEHDSWQAKHSPFTSHQRSDGFELEHTPPLAKSMNEEEEAHATHDGEEE